MANLKANTFVACLICGSENYEFICNSRTMRIPHLVTPISICRDCGFTFVNPRWTQDQYEKVNDLWFSTAFAVDPRKDVELKKWEKMDERISLYYPHGINNLLDIGAGQGWSIEYLQRKFPALNAFAVERWEENRERIERHYGGRVIGKDVEEDWDAQYENAFDLIILRHTLEHLLRPKEVLRKTRRCLSDDGYAYIVVPSMRQITRILLYSYFRPVHLSYFCEETFESLTRQAGLAPVILKEKNEGEVWGLFKKGETEHIKPDVYREMREVIDRYRRREAAANSKLLLRIETYHVLDLLKLRKPLSKLRRALLR